MYRSIIFTLKPSYTNPPASQEHSEHWKCSVPAQHQSATRRPWGAGKGRVSWGRIRKTPSLYKRKLVPR